MQTPLHAGFSAAKIDSIAIRWPDGNYQIITQGILLDTFNSFRSAAAEAAISRLYGGIHFRDAITAGEWQGKQVGTLAAQRFSKHLIHFK